MKKRAHIVVLILTIAFAARGLFFILSLPIGDPLDELFHMGYAEYIARTGRIPKSTNDSMPVENMRITATLPRTTAFGGPKLTFTEFMSMTRDEERTIRQKAFAAVPGEKTAFLGANYESQQPPLMYLVGAALLHVAGSWINVRLFVLRLIAVVFAASSVPLAYLFFRRLFRQSVALGATLAYVAFPGPGTFTSRFTNDALALPLAAATIVLLADVARGRLTPRKTIGLALFVAAGCWTKLYFLVFLPAIPAAALFAHREQRLQMLKRAIAAAVLAFVLIVPWMIRQHRDTGDWLGLVETKAAAKAGIGLMPRIMAIPSLVNRQFFEHMWNTYGYPGTWSLIGAPWHATAPALIGLILLIVGPAVARGDVSRERIRPWAGAATTLVFFGIAQLAHLTTFAAVHMSAGAEGWYSLILLPVVLAAAAGYGKSVPVALSIVSSVLFLATEYRGTFKTLRLIYAGGVKLRAFEVFSRAGILDAPAGLLITITAIWVTGLIAAAALITAGRRHFAE